MKTTFFHILSLGMLLSILTSCGGNATEMLPTQPLPTTDIITFTADTIHLQPSECATLRWTVQGGFGVELNGQVIEAVGETLVCPEHTTTYTISVDTGVKLEQKEIVIAVSKAGEEPLKLPETSPTTIPANSQFSVTRDLEYARYTLAGQEHVLLLDLFRPEGTQVVPVLVFLHGGGWIEGSKEDCPGTAFAQYGFAVACVDYRLAPMEGGCPAELIFPAQIQDVKAAVRWLRNHASEYGLDPNHFGAFGNSSGGHLASLLGTSNGIAELQGTHNLGVSDAVQAVADWYGPVDVTKPPPQVVFTDDPCSSGFSQLSAKYGGEETPYFYWTFAWAAFLGGSLDDAIVLKQAQSASPLTYVDASDPPFLILHGEADGMIPGDQSALLASALQAAGVEATFVRISGKGHNYFDPADPNKVVFSEFLDPTLQFFDKTLRMNAGESTTTIAVSPTAVPTVSETPSAAAIDTSKLAWVRTGGPPGGLGYDIRYNFTNPDIWYVTDAYGGVFRSTDNGKTWQPSNQGILPESGHTGDQIPIFSLTVDPHNPQIIWAGTDITGRIYKSTDGGLTWQKMDTGVEYSGHDSLSFRGFTIDPRTSDVVYAMAEIKNESIGKTGTSGLGIGGRVYKTINGGQNWEIIWDGGVPSSLARYMWIDPRNPDVLYVSTGIFDRGAVGETDFNTDTMPFGGLGVLKSTDGGNTWRELGKENGLDMLYIGSLYMHPEDPDVLLAAAGHILTPISLETMQSQGNVLGGVFRTEDGGEHWVKVVTSTGAQFDQSMSAVEICAPPYANIAYAGSNKAIYRSEDGGLTWRVMSGGEIGWGPPGVSAGWPIDLQCDPRDPQRIFANNYGGGNFLSEDGGASWQNSSQGYTGIQAVRVDVDPTNPAVVYSGDWRSMDGGVTWEGIFHPTNTGGGAMVPVAVDPRDPQRILGGSPAGARHIHVSLDQGETWETVFPILDENGEPVEPVQFFDAVLDIVFAPSDPNYVYAALGGMQVGCIRTHEPCFEGHGVIYSRDGGETWSHSTDPLISQIPVIDLAVHPKQPDFVFAATEGGLFRSKNGGETWMQLTIAENPAQARVRAVAVDPFNPQHILAGMDSVMQSVAVTPGIFLSLDGGITWQAAYAGLIPESSIHHIVFDPVRAQTVYVSDTFSGFYRSTDGGSTWAQINNGLTNRAVTGIAITSDGEHIYAATDGAGVFRLDLNGQPPESAATMSAIPPTASPTPKPPRAFPCGGAIALPLGLVGGVLLLRKRIQQ